MVLDIISFIVFHVQNEKPIVYFLYFKRKGRLACRAAESARKKGNKVADYQRFPV